jgi:serpin B
MTDRDPSVVDRELARLTPPAASGWADAPQFATIRRRRRQRQLAVTAVVAAVTVIAVVATLLTGGSHRRVPAGIAADLHESGRIGAAVQLVARDVPVAGPDPSAAASVASTEQRLALDLLRHLPTTDSPNQAVSATSLAMALSMLNLGARGRTQQQIQALLGPAGATADQIAAGWAGLVADWATAAAQAKITIATANSLWLQNRAPMVDSFMKALARYFAAGVWQVDFNKDPAGAAAALNQWVSEQTHGYIKDLLTADDVQGLLLVLVNALYFDAKWKFPFTEGSSPQPFTRADGSTVATPFMSMPMYVATTSGPAYQAAQLPYQGDRFAALVIEPTAVSLRQFVTGLSPSTLNGIVGSLHSGVVQVELPQFTVTTATDLKEPLSRLGLTDAFDPDRADFSGLTPRDAFVTFVKQKTFLNVNASGTQAAAATAIGMGDAAAHEAPKALRFDHPFLFLIRDTVTGAILFTATIQDPSAI